MAAFLSASAYAQPTIDAVLNGASFSASVSPGCWVTIFGKNLAAATATASAVPLPTSLGGASVKVSGTDAQLLYASPGQLNVLIPSTVAIPSNTAVPVMVAVARASATYNIRLARTAPGIFTRNGAGTGRAMVFDAQFAGVDTIGAQDAVTFYATGLNSTDAVDVYIGERKAQVTFAGPAPGFPGIYQVNAIAPVPATDRLYMSSGGWLSNITDIGIKPGANTANAAGTITPLYPSTDPFFTLPPCIGDDPTPPCNNGQSFSAMLNAVSFTASADLVPSAVPFDVAAVGPDVSALLRVDPATGTYSGTLSTVTQIAAAGDFSLAGFTLWDFFSCQFPTAVCFPFPGNLIPPNRLDPKWLQAIRTLPAANGPITPPNANTQVAGKLSGSHLAIDVQGFGGFLQVPFGPFDRAISTFKLYVDGKLVASKDVPYRVAHR